jgi:hypothetical protein
MPAKGTTRREPWNPLLKSYPFSQKVNAISIGAETLFTRLVAQADDYGNYYGSPRMLLATLYPHRWEKKEVNETDTGRWRAELVTCTAGPLAAMYSVNGIEYLHLLNSRRILRSDVSPDERFPREPANLEEDALSEYVAKTAHKRPINVPLDPDPYPYKTQRKTWFTSFWKIYPKKRGKGAAEKSFAKAVTSQLIYEAVMAGLTKHIDCADWEKDGGQYIPNPATWLNQRRWEDEPEQVRGSRKPGTSRGKAYYLNEEAQ